MSSFYGNGGYSSGSGSGGGGSLIVGATLDGEGYITLTSTWQEIYDAAAAGKTVVLNAYPYLLNIEYLQVVGIDNSNYIVGFVNTMTIATGPDRYPTTALNGGGGSVK